MRGFAAMGGQDDAHPADASRAAHPADRWLRTLRWQAATADAICALAGGMAALAVRFRFPVHEPPGYLIFTLLLPLPWCALVALGGGYDTRIIGLGSDEFRKVLNAGVSLAAAIAVFSYLTRSDIARGYVAVALPCATMLALIARYALRKRLHRQRRSGERMRRVVAIGHGEAVAGLITELRRETYHGMSVVAACLAGVSVPPEIAGVPVYGGLDRVPAAVADFAADTVAVLACQEMNGRRLRELAWQLEERGTDLCVAPALMDVAGPRTTVRTVAGLPLLQVDHPELTGIRQVIKALFDRAAALLALLVLTPLLTGIAMAIMFSDRGPLLFRQVRVGKDGRHFTLYKFRTMVAGAEQQQALLAAWNQGNGLLFKMRHDPRVTRTGAWLRRWSLDELPQLFNVVLGDMSLVGPRPALPSEAAQYGNYVRRRLAVKPGMTGLWQINGRSDLSWEESVRLDLRYVENWSFALDLQILWKTWSAVYRGSGAY